MSKTVFVLGGKPERSRVRRGLGPRKGGGERGGEGAAN